jgi:hypothetical protein
MFVELGDDLAASSSKVVRLISTVRPFQQRVFGRWEAYRPRFSWEAASIDIIARMFGKLYCRDERSDDGARFRAFVRVPLRERNQFARRASRGLRRIPRYAHHVSYPRYR